MSMPRATFLVLLALADRPRHGLGIVDRIEDVTEGETKLGPGTLYTTLQQLLGHGLIRQTAEAPDPDDHDSRRKYYRITPLGTRRLRDEARQIRRLSRAAARHVLGDS
jgi:DNA-binding PadR family transcriptional regulator